MYLPVSTLEQTIKNYAKDLGFDVVGIANAEPFFRDEHAAIERIQDGYMEGLPWYTEERVHESTHPERLLEGARSIISLAMSYSAGEPKLAGGRLRGRISRYAWGDDYHKVIKTRLKEFVAGLEDRVGRPVSTRVFVDDGPMNDRAAAERAGVGFFGKNSIVITPSHGSWVFLAQVITDLDLAPDKPLAKNCGECVRCMVACPTGAIVEPYVIDNTRCISYLTIELRGAIPSNLRPLVGDWIFGCDICQDVCPVNRKALVASEPAFRQRHDFAAPALFPLLELDDEGFRERFRDSPLKRPKRIGLQRNVCVALGNIGDAMAVPSLARALRALEPLVKVHAAWALGRIGGEDAETALHDRLEQEDDPEVIDEIRLALSEIGTPARSG